MPSLKKIQIPDFGDCREELPVIPISEYQGHISEDFPQYWSRIEKRKTFMREELGIKLDYSVLPLSNIPACLSPFLLSPDILYIS